MPRWAIRPVWMLLADELLDLLEHLLLVFGALKRVWSWGIEQKRGAGLRGAGGQEQSTCNQPASYSRRCIHVSPREHRQN